MTAALHGGGCAARDERGLAGPAVRRKRGDGKEMVNALRSFRRQPQGAAMSTTGDGTSGASGTAAQQAAGLFGSEVREVSVVLSPRCLSGMTGVAPSPGTLR